MTAVEWTITVTDAPAAEARGTIMQGLNRYNQEKAGSWDSRTLAVLTISFQAPGFYERLGYRRFGAIDCNPPGTSRIFFVKELS